MPPLPQLYFSPPTTEGDLDAILDMLPLHKGLDPAKRMQAIARGKSERTSFRKGVGTRNDITRKMNARVGVLLGGKHPVMLHAKATWLGSVSEIIATDLDGGVARLKLKTPFTPIAETGVPRKLRLVLTAQPDPLYDRHSIIMTFVDETTTEYLSRTLTMSFREHDTEGHILHQASAGHKEDEETDENAEERLMRTPSSLMSSLRFKDDHDVRTSIIDVDVERGMFVHDNVGYLYHVKNQENDTSVRILQVRTDRQVIFRMQREHLDRTFNMQKHVMRLMEIFTLYPRLGDIMQGREPEDDSTPAPADDAPGFWHKHTRNRQGVIFNGKLVLVRIFPKQEGSTVVRLFEANGLPLIGHSIENIDPEGLLLDLPSRRKRRARESGAMLGIEAAGGDMHIDFKGDAASIEGSPSANVITPKKSKKERKRERREKREREEKEAADKEEKDRGENVSHLRRGVEGDISEPKAARTPVSRQLATDEGGGITPGDLLDQEAKESDGREASDVALTTDDDAAERAETEGGDTFDQAAEGTMESILEGSMEGSIESSIEQEDQDEDDQQEGGDDKDEDQTEIDEEIPGKKGKGKKKKMSKKDKLKEERKLARQKILQKKIAAQAMEEGRGEPMAASAADNAKQLERDNKKKALKEKMAADKAAMEVAAKEKADKKKATEELKKKIQTASESAPKEAKIKAKKAAIQVRRPFCCVEIFFPFLPYAFSY